MRKGFRHVDHFQIGETTFFYQKLGSTDGPLVLWGHGWGQSHACFLPLAGSLEKSARHILIDFPGFGKSSLPPEDWGTENYADVIASWIKKEKLGPAIWVGHSFGGRVGIQLAAKYPELVKGAFLISAAGLKPQRPLHKKLYFKVRVALFKTLKKLIPLGLNENWLRSKFGSADYRSAGPLRSIFIRVVNEDLSAQARKITCPVKLLYGTQDTETPPDIGERLTNLIKHSQMVHLEGQDHYSVLSNGRHQVAPHLKQFIKDISANTHA